MTNKEAIAEFNKIRVDCEYLIRSFDLVSVTCADDVSQPLDRLYELGVRAQNLRATLDRLSNEDAITRCR